MNYLKKNSIIMRELNKVWKAYSEYHDDLSFEEWYYNIYMQDPTRLHNEF